MTASVDRPRHEPAADGATHRRTHHVRMVCRCGAGTLRAIVVALAVLAWSAGGEPARSQVPDLATGHIPTLAPLVREVTPAVVNISVQGKVREDNPLYKDPFFREFFDLPKQLEKEVSASGSGVIVDAERGYVLTANHVVAQISDGADHDQGRTQVPGQAGRPRSRDRYRRPEDSRR